MERNTGSVRWSNWSRPLGLRFLGLGLSAWFMGCPALASADTQGRPPTANAGSPDETSRTSDVVPPRLLDFVPAEYPDRALRGGDEASVVLELDISSHGTVSDVRVHESGGQDFDAAAMAAARQFRFAPARRADSPVASRILYRYVFELQPQELPIEYSGTVLDEASGSPLANVPVVLRQGAELRTLMTDSAGRWTLTGIHPGPVQVSVDLQGYAPLEFEDVAADGDSKELTLSLRPVQKPEPAPDDEPIEVTVTGHRVSTPVVVRHLSRAELQKVPGTFGDALRAVQSLPGVAQTPTLSGLLVVRGTGPESTQVFINGVLAPQVYHFGGLSSVVPTEMLESIEFQPGNFGVKYGRGIGGIVDATVRRSRGDGQYHGMVQVDFIDARAIAEGPVPEGSDWRFLAGVRRSHLDAWLGPILEGTNTRFNSLPVYSDYQFFLDRETPRGDYVRVGFIGADDKLSLLSDTSVFLNRFSAHNAFWNLTSEYQSAPHSATQWSHVISVGRLIERIQVGPIQAATDAFPMVFRGELTHGLSDAFTLRMGPDIIIAPHAIEFSTPEENLTGNALATSAVLRPPRVSKTHGMFVQPAAYVELSARASRWTLTPGLRLDYIHETDQFDLSPRIHAEYRLGSDLLATRLTAAAGLYHEPPEVRHTLDVYGNPELRSMRSFQSAVGVQQALTAQVDVSANVFYSKLERLTSQTPDANGVNQFSATGSGRVYGTEWMLKYKADKRFFGWLTYTLSRSERRANPDDAQRLFDFDQTHIASILGSYQLGAGWELGARFRLVSGVPELACGQKLWSSSESATLCLPGGDTMERRPWFHQLDARVEKRWSWDDTFSLSVYLNVINVYNREQADLPLVPALGLRGEL